MASEPKMKGLWIWTPRRRFEDAGAGIERGAQQSLLYGGRQIVILSQVRKE